MASKKNQHFVPKVHLSAFSSDPDGNSISLFNIRSARVIHGAGIKHQCARSYFYGSDGKLEDLFGEVEGRYALAVRNARNGIFTAADCDWMRIFMALQSARTEVAAEQMREFHAKSAAITFRGKAIPEEQRPPMDWKNLLGEARQAFRSINPMIKDLRFCIIRNRTKVLFLTSDNPLVNTNRFYAQRLQQDNWGVGSAGAMFLMPLTPRLAVAFYDDGMYSPQHDGGYCDMKKVTDVQALNDMQYLNAYANIYFSDPGDADRIVGEFGAVSDRRVTELARLVEFGAVEMPDGRDRIFRLKPGMDEQKMDSKYIQYSTPRPFPPRWPSIMPFRMKIRAYTNGSAAGYVRNPEWLTKGFPDRDRG